MRIINFIIYRLNFFIIKRFLKHLYQRIIRGWDDSETWSLDHSLAKLILPRLKRFKELQDGHPSDLSEKEWDEIIDKMIFAFEWYSDDPWCKEVPKEVNEGIELFSKWYRDLWW